ncbi:glycosyltransferase [Microbacterium sp. ARD31]|uniref:glycosyltransferase n=1 Tax=Microbacterium sp. ARD31 TaxID=2962576 RepID=UPI002881ACD6|nr:glycosyltransferase [Microbacterium sp. ARD31]MDT0188470.1 glycosyltransferase [Microbacterium sp. ARD31]
MTDLVLLVLLLAAAAVPLLLLRDLRAVPTSRSGATGRPTVSVVVPARDEEQTLPALLAALRGSTVPVVEVVVVDDGSTDRTAEVARDGGARVLAAGAPPVGWTGKAWACHVGAGGTTGDLLLFLDADTVLAPDALAGLLELHARHGGLVSVQPHHRVEQPYEQLSAYFNVVALMSSDAFSAGPSRRPMAFGPCLLTSRDDYLAVGGHAAVRGEILDDVRLAHEYDASGLPVTCAVGGPAVTMRSYPGGLRQLVSGWTKNIASGAAAAAPRASLGTVLWICAHHAVAAGALLSLAGAAVGRDLAAGSPLVWTLGWLLTAGQLRALLRRAGSFRWWTWALFPLPLLAFDLVFARSALLTVVRRSVRWRGRVVDLRDDRPAREVG